MAAADEQNQLRLKREAEAKTKAEAEAAAKAAARQKRMDEIAAERDARMKAEAEARAKSNPMFDPTNRPAAPPADDKFVYYYGWIGGAGTGQWKLYKQAKTNESAAAVAATRSTAGQTQATFSTAVGANTVTKPITTPATTTPSTTTPSTTTPSTTTPSTTTPSTSTPSTSTPATSTPATSTPSTSTTPTTSSYTQAELDKAIAEAVAKAEAATAAAVEKAKRDAEIAAAAKAAAGKGGLTQEDLDRAIREALAKQKAATDAAAREANAAQEALKLAQKQKASDRLVALFKTYGLETLAGFIDRRIKADVSEEMLMVELYDQPEYQLRFPGMAALRAKGKTISEKEYIDNEKAFIQTARFFDIPKGFYDSADDFGALIGNLVSPKEFQDRLQVGQDLARSLNPAVKSQLIEFYGVGEGDLTAFVLDADRALPLIQKQAKAAQFVGIGRAAGFKLGGMTAQQAEKIAGTESYAKLSEAELAKALGTAGQLRSTQERLARLEGAAYNEQEALSAVIEGSPEALLASQQRAQREAARFSTRSGLSGSSLRSTQTAI